MPDGISLPSNPRGHVGSMRIKATKQHPLGASHHRIFSLAMVTLLAVAFGFNPTAHAQDVATTSGVHIPSRKFRQRRRCDGLHS
jgi:hypothetical protein